MCLKFLDFMFECFSFLGKFVVSFGIYGKLARKLLNFIGNMVVVSQQISQISAKVHWSLLSNWFSVCLNKLDISFSILWSDSYFDCWFSTISNAWSCVSAAASNFCFSFLYSLRHVSRCSFFISMQADIVLASLVKHSYSETPRPSTESFNSLFFFCQLHQRILRHGEV